MIFTGGAAVEVTARAGEALTSMPKRASVVIFIARSPKKP
jgi:hypothetical protein